MINSITLRNIATYDSAGTKLENLKKINFVYGANGSGKTTLSNFISNFEDSKYPECEIIWENSEPIKTLVYNKEFRDKNFGKSSLKGVFTLGGATADEIKEIDKKRAELEEIKILDTEKKKTHDSQQERLDATTSAFTEKCWTDVYKKYEDSFKEAFKGSISKKEAFRDKLLSEFDTNSSAIVSPNELNQKSKIIFGKVPENISEISNIVFDEIGVIEEGIIWTTKIIGKSDVDISKLIQKLNLNDWVNQGRSYLQDDDVCPFCQQHTIADDFKKQLEDYFDKSFLDSTNQIKVKSNDYFLLSQNLINELTQIENNQKNNPETKLDVDKFSAYLKTFNAQFVSNKELLSNKIKEPSRSIELISTKEQLENIKGIIKQANLEIKKHNEIVKNYQMEKKNLIASIWKYVAESYKSEIETYRKQSDGLAKGIKKLNEEYLAKKVEYKTLNDEIKDLTKNVTSVQPTVDEINRLLKSYGFLNFEITPSEKELNHYQIKREDGTLAEETLSEGEITFLTFLYFLQLTKGATDENKITDKKILVIDDPISSLDSNILFVVSTLIKNITQDIKNNIGNIQQLILLTHNVYFHKEVSFIDGRNNGDKNTFYWIVRKKNKISTFNAYEMNNPIQTSYQLLWQELNDKEKNSSVTIQNTMRRIIENYFKILGDYKDNSLISKFEILEEQIICKSLMSWINDGSHVIQDDLYIELQDDVIDKYLEVFKKIFVFTNHEGHYNMMMKIENLGTDNAQ